MKRILLVDDEPEIENGLQHLLRKSHRDMDMVFARGSEAAFTELGKAAFDVVVADMRMRGMSGMLLLRKVKDEYPDVARIILCGQADRDALLSSLPVSHQFLSKPCNADHLCNVIERTCRLRALLVDESLRKRVGSIDRLPSIPAIYHELMSAIANPEASTQSISRIVERDPAMSAKILQLVNSAFFGSIKHIARIDRAVTYLGMDLIKNLALTVHAFTALSKASGISRFAFEEHQRHALLTAKVASRLFFDGPHAQSAFTAGLLHDIGKLVLAVSIGEQYRTVVELCKTTGRLDHEVELEILGVTHSQVGAYLLGLWGLPYPIVEAVAYHHDPVPAEEREFDLPSATWLANALVNREIGESVEINIPHLERLNVVSNLPKWTSIADDEVHLKQAKP